MDREQVLDQQFHSDAEESFTAIRWELDQKIEVITAMKAFYDSSRSIDAEQFQTFTKSFLSHHQAIQALEWIPRILASERASHESQVKQAGYPNYQLTERQHQGVMIRASEREEYFPVCYVQPYESNRVALGFDLGSSVARRQALAWARDTGSLTVTEPITLVQEKSTQTGFLAFVPVYQKGKPVDTVDQRRTHLMGFVLGVFRVGDIVENALARLGAKGLQVRLTDEQSPEDRRHLYTHRFTPADQTSAPAAEPPDGPLDTGGLHRSVSWTIGGRTWSLECTPSATYTADIQSNTPALVFVGGLLLSLLGTRYLYVLANHTSRIEREVLSRTEELRKTNEALGKEMADRRQAQERLKASEEEIRNTQERFDLAVKGSNDGLWDWYDTRRDQAFWWSARFDELLGYPEGELIPSMSTLRHLLHPDDVERVMTAMDSHLEGRLPYDIDYRLQTKIGTYRWFRARGQAVRDPQGHATRMSGSLQDISERKAHERLLKEHTENLERLAIDLKQKNCELDEFTHVASHDLQEPLRKLVSFSTLLRKDVGDNLTERAETDLKYITDAAHRMQQLVRDLLSLSQTGRTTLELAPVQLETCATRAIDALSEAIKSADATITRAGLPEVQGDLTLLTQLYQNLISNAIKYCKTNPAIHLTVENGPDGPIFGVKDNGIGIREEYQEQIFAAFKRLHSRDQYSGTGIGLATCRKVIERHNGELWVESEPGRGSHFKFTLFSSKKDNDMNGKDLQIAGFSHSQPEA